MACLSLSHTFDILLFVRISESIDHIIFTHFYLFSFDIAANLSFLFGSIRLVFMVIIFVCDFAKLVYFLCLFPCQVFISAYSICQQQAYPILLKIHSQIQAY